MPRNASNSRHYVCSIHSVPGHYEQHHHVAMYQFHDLATFSGVNLLEETNATTNNGQANEIALE